MLRIVMDDAGDIPEDWLSKYDIQVIPINLHFNNKIFRQGVDLNNDDFYHLVETTGVIPKTSQPTPQQFVEFYKRIAQASDTILLLHVTSKMSRTYNSAVLAAQELKNQLDIIPFDTGSGSLAIGFMCKEIRQLENSGATLQSILSRLNDIRQRVNIVLTLDTLEHARLSGLVKALQAALAAWVKIKLIIILKDGVLDMREKVRTSQRAVDRVTKIIHERVNDRLINVAVVTHNRLKPPRIS
jgi:DegV family protein with EDD domain